MNELYERVKIYTEIEGEIFYLGETIKETSLRRFTDILGDSHTVVDRVKIESVIDYDANSNLEIINKIAEKEVLLYFKSKFGTVEVTGNSIIKPFKGDSFILLQHSSPLVLEDLEADEFLKKIKD